MNMSFISIQFKSKDKDLPMNGKLLSIVNVHSVGYNNGEIVIKYEDSFYKVHEVKYKTDEISYYFIN